MKNAVAFSLLLILSLALPAFAAEPPRDFGAAREWCDRNMLRRPEGIWEFPDDETTVLIRRSDSSPRSYDIIAVDSPDTRIRPGETIGQLRESAEADKFEMTLCRSGAAPLSKEAGKCLAVLRDNDNTIVARGRKMKISLGNGARWLLPAFWRMIKVTVKDPLESLPRGLVRLYPERGPRQPDYL